MEPIRDLDAGTLRRVDWRELIPATLLLRALTLSVRWLPILGGALFCVSIPLLWNTEPLPIDAQSLNVKIAAGFSDVCGTLDGPCVESIIHAVTGFRSRICAPPADTNYVGKIPALFVFFFFALFFSLMTARAAAVRLASTERAGIAGSFRFALSHYKSALLGVLLPIFLATLCLLPVWLLSLAPSSVYFSLFPVELFCAFLATLLILGLIFGHPLIIAAVATDRCDGFDAFSRAFSYLFGRPFHFLFYLAVTVLLSAVGIAVVGFIVRMTVALTAWVGIPNVQLSGDSPIWLWGMFWFFLMIFMTPVGFLFIFKYHAFTAIYLMLRRSVDDVAFDIFAAADEQKPHRLPPILADAEGAPVMADDAAAVSSEKSGAESTGSEHRR